MPAMRIPATAARRLQPYLLLALLALPALWPLAGPGLPRTNDNLTHLFRVVELDALLRAGVLFPRWAPDLVHGYGYPIFNYFPYLAHALVEALHLLGLNFLTAYNAACGLALLASAWLAYRLGRAHFGHLPGLVAGVAYLYSPYLLYDTYIRGSLPENLALALLPLVLLQLRQAAQGRQPALAYAALALAAALFSHHGVMLQAMPFLVAYAVLQSLSDDRRPLRATDDRLSKKTNDKVITPHTATATPTSVTPHLSPQEGTTKVVTTVSPSLTNSHTHTPTHFFASPLTHLHTFTLALLLSAFFWLPALAESGYVQIARGTGNGGMSYIDNFLSLRELLALPRLPVDPALLNPPVVRSLPLAALVLAALTLARWLYQRLRPNAARAFTPQHTRALAFFALAALLGVLLIHPLSRPLWDALPLLRLTLFPWRLLGPISLFISLLAGALFVDQPGNQGIEGNEGNKGTKVHSSTKITAAKTSVVHRAKRSSVVGYLSSVVRLFILPPAGFFGAFILLVLPALPFATPPREAVSPAPTLADLARFEVPPDFIGTTTVGEYLPVWVRALPDTAPNRDQLLAGQPVQRHEAPGAEVRITESGAVGDRYTVTAPQPVTFTYRAFYFPGWRATLDGKPVPLTVTDPHGLMQVAVPAGAHSLSFQFGSTPIRIIGALLSLLGLAATAAVLIQSRRSHRHPHSEASFPAANLQLPASSTPSPFILQPSAFILPIFLALVRPLLYDAGLTPLLRRGAQPGLVLNHDYAGELTLLGAEASAAALRADDELLVNLYWQANHPLGIPYGFDVRLVDAAGHTWSQPDLLRPRDWRFTPGTDFWPTDQYILDPYRLLPIPGAPPGAYTVRVTVFARGSLQSIGAQDVLAVTITEPTRARPCPTDTAPASGTAWDGAQLVSVRFSTTRAAPGDDLVFSPCWNTLSSSAERVPRRDLSAELRLLDRQGLVVARQPFTLGGPYPTSRWELDDVLRDQVAVRLPAALASGDYLWALSVDNAPAVALGPLVVTAPARAFTAPPVDTVLNANLGPLTLHGFTLPRAGLARGSNLPLNLVWQANALMPDSYHVFVHLLAADGSLAAQSDGIPADWARRTTGWLPGEYVTDARTLLLRPDLAPGAYTLWAGVYLPATGQRLATEEFGDGRVALGEVVVE